MKALQALLLVVAALLGNNAHAQSVTKTFAQLGAGQTPLRLPTWQASYTLKLPLSPREVLAGAKLRLDTANSTALIKSRSELTIRLNGRVLAQHPLDPQNPRKTIEMALPLELIKPGYNELAMEVVQHYTYDCEDPASPELWTEIDPIRSTVTFDFAGIRPNTSPRLSQLGVAFDARGWMDRPVALVVGTDVPTEGQLAAAGLAFQGIALRMGARPVLADAYSASTALAATSNGGRIPYLNADIVKGKDVVLVGTRATIARYLDAEVAEAITAPFVGLFAANNGESVVVVVSGTNDEEVMRAARSIAESQYKFSDVAAEHVLAIRGFDPPKTLAYGKTTPFQAAGYRTTTVRGLKVQPIDLEFRAPGDFGAKKGDLAAMLLHFSYGAGLRTDSSLVIKLNGHFVTSVGLSEMGGIEFQKYELRLPAELIHAGYNTVSFEAVMTAHKDRCDMLREEQLILTIFDDSTFELPSPTVSPLAPDLARFSRSLWPMDKLLTVFVNNTDSATASATMSMFAMMAQKNRAPIDTEVKFSAPADGNFLMVGTFDKVPPHLAASLPLGDYNWKARGVHAGLLQGVHDKSIVTALLAPDPQIARTAVKALATKGLWEGLSGQGAVIDTVEQTMSLEPAQKQVKFGGPLQITGGVKDWRLIALTAVVLSALFALTLIAALRRTAKKRQSGVSKG